MLNSVSERTPPCGMPVLKCRFKKARQSGMNEDRARYLDIEQMDGKT